jgi:hypothetical protein
MNHLPPPRPPPPAYHRRAAPRAAPVVLNVGDFVSVGGNLFQVTATLVPAGSTPTPVPVPVPVPVPPVPVPVPVPVPPVPIPGPTPSVAGFRDATGNWVPTNGSLPAGSLFWIEGAGFGVQPGSLAYAAALPVTVLKWTDTEILASVPSQPFPTVNTLLVKRPDGAYYLSNAFSVTALPAGRGGH